MTDMAIIYISKVTFEDKSFFWRGECNCCDWIDEAIITPELYSRAQVHLKVFHNGGIINHYGYKEEVKGNG